MDVMSAASTLREQLIALHNSDSTTSILDGQCTRLHQQSLMAAIDDNQSQHLGLVFRLSVTKGVRNMYGQYSNSKWTEVQNTARSIKSNLEADNSEQTSPVMTSSPPGAAPVLTKQNLCGPVCSVNCPDMNDNVCL